MCQRNENMSIYNRIIENKADKNIDILTYSPVALAYIGDSVYETYIRSLAMCHGNKKVEALHKEVTAFSRASTQAVLLDILLEKLSDEEISIFKRGRNASKHSQAKHQKLSDYKKSTGFEALIGWLYMKGEDCRVLELLEFAINEYCENLV